jgi:hypothetical protein
MQTDGQPLGRPRPPCAGWDGPPSNNSSDADAISTANIGADCYIVDDQTVALTNGTNTRSVAGKIFDVDSAGVWVDMR